MPTRKSVLQEIQEKRRDLGELEFSQWLNEEAEKPDAAADGLQLLRAAVQNFDQELAAVLAFLGDKP